MPPNGLRFLTLIFYTANISGAEEISFHFQNVPRISFRVRFDRQLRRQIFGELSLLLFFQHPLC